jgi:DNA-binding NtrC family response regulator
MKVLVVTKDESLLLEPKGLLAIGGKEASGSRIPGLAKKDDYLVISPLSRGGISVVPLKGKDRRPLELKPLEKIQIEDLLLIPLPSASSESEEKPGNVAEVLAAIKDISEAPDENAVYGIVLKQVIKLASFDRGLVVAKNPAGSFEIIAHHGADPSAPWLSESLLQETLSSGKPVVIPSVIGSRFESNKSLVGTGFLAVAAWPLVWRGEVVGALVVGSNMPHDGSQGLESSLIGLFSPFVAQHVSGWIREKRLERQLQRLENKSQDDAPFLSQSPVMQNLINMARRVAPSDLSVLIQGETGVGKEVLAKWLHSKGPNPKGPFVPVNCGAIPENLIESTLFGHKKGSFTGAINDQIGKFVQAHGGTLFLDEIGDLPLNVQGKLLRALQEKSIEPLGAGRPISVQVRVLCASHKNLTELVKKGLFREDLYYRLAEITLEIPPLRLRPEDTILIAQDLLKQINADKKLSADAWEWLQNQRWPGNVRELLTALRRAILMSQKDTLEARDFLLPNMTKAADDWLGGQTLDLAMKNFQMEKVRRALERSQGNRQEAARLLGITSRTLFRYLEDMREGEV